jgi:hypothetical protein
LAQLRGHHAVWRPGKPFLREGVRLRDTHFDLGQQLRPALRRGGAQLRHPTWRDWRAHRDELVLSTKRAMTCGPAPTATSAAASTLIASA